MTELDAFRAQKDQFFKAHSQSTLTPEQQQTFQTRPTTMSRSRAVVA